MGKENAVSRPFTRALASSLRASTIQNQQRANTKRPASEDNKNVTARNKKKRREVLRDISNASFNPAKLEAKNIKQVKKGLVNTSRSGADAKAEVVSVTAGSLCLCKGTNDTADNCNFRLPPRPLVRSASIVEKSAVIGSSTALDIPKFIDIDSDDKDPLLLMRS